MGLFQLWAQDLSVRVWSIYTSIIINSSLHLLPKSRYIWEFKIFGLISKAVFLICLHGWKERIVNFFVINIVFANSRRISSNNVLDMFPCDDSLVVFIASLTYCELWFINYCWLKLFNTCKRRKFVLTRTYI